MEENIVRTPYKRDDHVVSPKFKIKEKPAFKILHCS